MLFGFRYLSRTHVHVIGNVLVCAGLQQCLHALVGAFSGGQEQRRLFLFVLRILVCSVLEQRLQANQIANHCRPMQSRSLSIIARVDICTGTQ